MFFRFSNQSVKTSLGKCRAAETWLPLFRNYLGNSFTNFQFIHEITAIFMLQNSQIFEDYYEFILMKHLVCNFAGSL